MELAILLIVVFLMGFVVAIPAGPVQIEVVRRSVNGFRMSSFMVILGAFMVDMFYGTVALFGIAPFLKNRTVMSVFWLTGSVILAVLGTYTIVHSRRPHDLHQRSVFLGRKRWGLLTGISLSITNPVMIIWWLSSLQIFTDLGLVTALTLSTALSYLVAGSLGLAAYLAVLSLVLYRVKDFISIRKMKQIDLVLGIFLTLLAAYFFVHSIGMFIDRPENIPAGHSIPGR
ncbi:MAG: LysE family transporter [Nitrospirae bacterium]|nr:LysE family transporter [Nitrospirota bacterium]